MREDLALEMSLTTRAEGLFAVRRNDHRISAANTVHLAMDLVPHAADWRAGLGWMVRRYPEFFDPPNSRAHDVAGLGAYSDSAAELDAARFKRMGFRVNWK